MFCRLCAQEQPHTIPIFSDTSLKIDKLLYRLFLIKVYREDVLPTVICLDCFRTTNVLNEFKKRVNQAQELLKLLNITNKEIEMVNFEEMEPFKPVIEESNCVKPVIEESNCVEQVIEESNYVEQVIEESNYVEHVIEESDYVEPAIEESDYVEPAIEESDFEIVADTEIYKDEVEQDELMRYEGNDELDSESNEKLPRPRRHEFKNLLCTDCDEISRSPLRLTKHFEKKHHKEVQFKCTYCPQIYQKYRSFTRHVMTHVEPNRFVCELCDRSFSQKCALKNHFRSHLKDHTFECKECHLKFKQLTSLLNHRKAHTHVYSCDECKKIFSTPLTLSQHKEAEHFDRKDKICDICNKGYSSLSGLYYHQLSHLEQRHFCFICDRKFNTKFLLKRHMNLHKYDYTCEICGKSFKSQNSLILHKKIHDEHVEYSDVLRCMV